MPKSNIADWELDEAIEKALELGIDVHEEAEQYEQAIEEMFMEDPLSAVRSLVQSLIPMAFIARSELSGKVMQGFGDLQEDGHIVAIVKQER